MVLGSVFALVASVFGAFSSANADVPPVSSGWEEVWSDDFDGEVDTLPSSDHWIIDTGTSYPGGPPNWGTEEIQTYTKNLANLKQDGKGNLKITPIKDSSGAWTSARIETKRSDFQPGPGGKMRIEARIQVPNVTGMEAAGYWPAFWTLGDTYRSNHWSWPGIGEFDIMENVNGVDSVWGVMHCGVVSGGPCHETDGISNSRACPGSTCQSAFHTYTLEWDRSVTPETLRWFVDGEQYHSVNATQMDAQTWEDATHHGHFILLNVAMGGKFPNGQLGGTTTPTAATVSGRPMIVDYVAVTKASSNSTTGGSTGGSTGGTGGTSGWDAYSNIQAERYTAQSGVTVQAMPEGGKYLAKLANGDWVRYSDVRFGSTAATQFKARVASGAPSGVSGLVEVRLDSRTSEPIGTFAVANTGGWQSWRTVPMNISAVTGTHDVFLTFTSGQPADFVNLNWFTFSTS